jgi:AcrR family transcriptional regulator
MSETQPPSETQEAIMAATYRAVCKHGYADLTMRYIAAEFEKSRALLHYHYDTKEDLLVALIEYLVSQYVETMGPRTNDPHEALERFVRVSLFEGQSPLSEFPTGFAEFHTALLEIRVQAPRHEAFRIQLDRSHEAIHDQLTGTIEEGIERGEFRDVDAARYADLLIDAVDGTRTRALTLGHEDAPEHSYETICETLIAPLRAD